MDVIDPADPGADDWPPTTADILRGLDDLRKADQKAREDRLLRGDR